MGCVLARFLGVLLHCRVGGGEVTQHTPVEVSGNEMICDECSADAGVRMDWPCRPVLIRQMQRVSECQRSESEGTFSGPYGRGYETAWADFARRLGRVVDGDNT